VKGHSKEEEVHEDGAKPSAHGHGGQRPASRNPPARRLWHSSASIPPTLGDAQAVLLPSRAGGASARARGRRPPAKTPRTNLHISIENVGEGSRRSPQLVTSAPPSARNGDMYAGLLHCAAGLSVDGGPTRRHLLACQAPALVDDGVGGA
jgi:hypothetical protein